MEIQNEMFVLIGLTAKHMPNWHVNICGTVCAWNPEHIKYLKCQFRTSNQTKVKVIPGNCLIFSHWITLFQVSLLYTLTFCLNNKM